MSNEPQKEKLRPIPAHRATKHCRIVHAAMAGHEIENQAEVAPFSASFSRSKPSSPPSSGLITVWLTTSYPWVEPLRAFMKGRRRHG